MNQVSNTEMPIVSNTPITIKLPSLIKSGAIILEALFDRYVQNLDGTSKRALYSYANMLISSNNFWGGTTEYHSKIYKQLKCCEEFERDCIPPLPYIPR